MINQTCPQQTDSVSCGVYVAMNAEQIFAGLAPGAALADPADYRERRMLAAFLPGGDAQCKMATTMQRGQTVVDQEASGAVPATAAAPTKQHLRQRHEDHEAVSCVVGPTWAVVAQPAADVQRETAPSRTHEQVKASRSGRTGGKAASSDQAADAGVRAALTRCKATTDGATRRQATDNVDEALNDVDVGPFQAIGAPSDADEHLRTSFAGTQHEQASFGGKGHAGQPASAAAVTEQARRTPAVAQQGQARSDDIVTGSPRVSSASTTTGSGRSKAAASEQRGKGTIDNAGSSGQSASGTAVTKKQARRTPAVARQEQARSSGDVTGSLRVSPTSTTASSDRSMAAAIEQHGQATVGEAGGSSGRSSSAAAMAEQARRAPAVARQKQVRSNDDVTGPPRLSSESDRSIVAANGKRGHAAVNEVDSSDQPTSAAAEVQQARRTPTDAQHQQAGGNDDVAGPPRVSYASATAGKGRSKAAAIGQQRQTAVGEAGVSRQPTSAAAMAKQARRTPAVTQQEPDRRTPTVAQQEPTRRTPAVAQQEPARRTPAVAQQEQARRTPTVAQQEQPRRMPAVAQQEQARRKPAVAKQEQARRSPAVAQQEQARRKPAVAKQE